MPISRRKRAPKTLSKNQRSRARSGRLHRRVRRSGLPRSGCHPPAPTTPAPNHAGRTGLARNHAPLVAREAPRALIWNHAPLESRFPPRAFRTTGVRTTPAPRAFRTTGVRTTPAPRASARRSWQNVPSGSPIRHIQNEEGMRIALPRTPNAE